MLIAALYRRKAKVSQISSLERKYRTGYVGAQGGTMYSGRAILVLLIALSVTIMPTRSVMALNINPTEIAASATMPDCCDGQDMPCEKSVNGCPLMALCASTSVGLVGASIADFTFPLIVIDNVPSLASFGLDSQPSSPPFRPPRS